MMHRVGTFFPFALLVVVAGLSLWLDREVQPPERGPDAKARHDPDYIVENFSTTRIGPAGTPLYTLSGSRMVHYPDDDSTHIEEPKLVHLARSPIILTVTSRTGLVSSNGENAYLRDDVRIVRSAYEGKSEMIMTTSYLHVIPEEEIARTDQLVRISDANILITSVGLEFNNVTQVLKLLSKVRGTYAANP